MSSRGGRSDTTDTETRTFRDPSTRPPQKRTKPKPTNQPLCHNHQTDDVTTTTMTMTMKHENDTTTNNKQTNSKNKQTNNNNKTTNNLKSRATAKEQVANVWKERRQHSHTCHADQTAAPSQLQQQKQLQQQQKQLQKQQQQPMVGLFSLCGMVQKAWDDWKVATSVDAPPRLSRRPSSRHHNNNHTNNNKLATRTANGGFPSVVSILQATALAQHVQEWQEQQEEEEEDKADDDKPARQSHSNSHNNNERTTKKDTNHNHSSSSNHHHDDKDEHEHDNPYQSLWQVLPAGYDWYQAIHEMARSRSRAFLLFDLTALVHRLVLWKQTLQRLDLWCCSSSSSSSSQYSPPRLVVWHAVQANADAKLLHVLSQSGIVALATTTRTDLLRAMRAGSTTHTTTTHTTHTTTTTHTTNTTTTTHTTTNNATTTVPMMLLDASAGAASGAGGPTDAYLRELVWTAHVTTTVVDGPDDLRRVWHSLQRMAARRPHERHQQPLHLSFLLRLPTTTTTTTIRTRRRDNDNNNDNNNDNTDIHGGLLTLWKDRVAQMLEAIQECNQQQTAVSAAEAGSSSSSSWRLTCQLDGISVAMALEGEAHSPYAAAAVSAWVQQRQAAIEQLIYWIYEQQQQQEEDNYSALRLDLTGWKGTTTTITAKEATTTTTIPPGHINERRSSKASVITHTKPSHRATATAATTTAKYQQQQQQQQQQLPMEWLTWCRDLLMQPIPGRATESGNATAASFLVRQVTMEATAALVEPVGALCTRLIGVKTTNVRDERTGQTTIRRHYYIDDGCYGSLYHHGAVAGGGTSSAGYQPLPLYPQPSPGRRNPLNHQQDDDKEEEENPDENTPPPVHLSTVWGPTCDGLDRVCQDIPLPELQRDDWLVFPNLGAGASEGLGTAFNGFAPPDTVYCVLDYFK